MLFQIKRIVFYSEKVKAADIDRRKIKTIRQSVWFENGKMGDFLLCTDCDKGMIHCGQKSNKLKKKNAQLTHLNKDGEYKNLGGHFHISIVAVRCVWADNGTVLVIGKVGILLLVVWRSCISRGGCCLGSFGVVRPSQEASTTRKTPTTSCATRKGTAPLWLWTRTRGLSCGIQPRS